MTVRTRFAPSPTGFLHLGGARTALYSWAYARHHGGQFVLRIEDTDVERSTPEAVQAIIDGMQWLGLQHDEGPFYQMKRMDRYREVIDQMLKEGTAYYCYCSHEELEVMREKQKAAGESPRYDGTWRPEPGKTLPAVPEGRNPVCLLYTSSIGFMMDSVQPLAWRAPMITQAVMQLLQQTKWQDLDYLLIDMPPGTGDIQLTLSQKAPLTGAIVVTTPQDVAVLDARKGLMMFQKMNVDVLGIVENMSSYVCSHCGQIEHIFGKDGGKLMSEAYGVDSLGEIPLNIAVREQTDNGKPVVVAEPDGLMAGIFRDIACRLAAKVALKPKDTSGLFPPIVKAE